RHRKQADAGSPAWPKREWWPGPGAETPWPGIPQVTRRRVRPYLRHQTRGRNEGTPCVLSARGAGANRRPQGGRIAQEANAPGKARGYADVGTVVWRVEPTDGVQALPGNDGWDRLPWFLLEQELTRLQTRIYRASGAVTIRQRRGHHDVVWMT